jgi:hypothetical protein
MNSSPHAQSYAYRRNPAQSVHHSTFHPGQVGHGHGSTTVATRPQAHYTTSVAPFQPVQTSAPEITEKEDKPASSSSGFNLASLAKYANIDELKGLVDRFGGLEGILSTVTTVQKVVSTVGQIAPMVKVFTGVLGKNKESKATEDAAIPARRRVRSTRPPQRTGKTTRKGGSTPPSRRNTQARPTSATGPRRSAPLTTRSPIGRR